MRTLGLLFVLLPSCAVAQPGWRALRFSFVLVHHGVEVPASELRQGNDFVLEVQGERTRPFSFNESRFSTVEFPEIVSDITQHRDTLWLRIRHRHEGVMEIGFPPRAGARSHDPYSTGHAVVDFAPGRVLVTDLPKELRVTGVIEGLGFPWNVAASFDLSAHCGCNTVPDVAISVRPIMDFTLPCRTKWRNGREWAELVFFTPSGAYRPALDMVVSGLAGGGHWPLDTIGFTPTRFVKDGGGPLVPDDTGPRDVVLGMQALSSWFRISPVNPTAADAVRFTLQWLGGGERLRLSHELKHTANDITEIVLTVRRERYEEDPRPRFQLNAVAHEVPALSPGFYRLRLVYAEEPGMPVPRFPEAEGFAFRVVDRPRP